jgi:hypothetical protein
VKVGGLYNLVGIVSAAIAKNATINGEVKQICDLKNYLVYTDVAKFHDWIDQVLVDTT